MKIWKFENGIEVRESEYNYDLHCFEVYHDGRYLGDVCPGTIEDMEYCMAALNNGEDPISGGWDDGNTHPCTLDGWADLDW